MIDAARAGQGTTNRPIMMRKTASRYALFSAAPRPNPSESRSDRLPIKNAPNSTMVNGYVGNAAVPGSVLYVSMKPAAMPKHTVPAMTLSDSLRASSTDACTDARERGGVEAGTCMFTTLASGSKANTTMASVESLTRENARHTSAPTSEPKNTSGMDTLLDTLPNVMPHAVRSTAAGMPRKIELSRINLEGALDNLS